LAGEWQLVSDLSFADLLLWVKLSDDDAFVCIAQVTPDDRPTAYEDDQVGRVAAVRTSRTSRSPRYRADLARRRPVWYGDVPGPQRGDPVRRPGRHT